MSRKQVTITYINEMLENPEIRTLINTILDAFCYICGFYADDILFVGEQSEKKFNRNELSLLNEGDQSNNYYSISFCVVFYI